VTALLEAFQNLMDSQPGLVGWVIAQLIVLPLTVLLHELGHAAMAVVRAQPDVRLEVGSGPIAWRGRLARIDMAVHPLVVPAGMGGAVSFDATRASATDVLLVALAGPVASLIGTVIAWIWFASTPDDAGLASLLAVAAATGLFVTIVNLAPMSIRDRNGAVMWRTDGWHALSAAKILVSLR
jgi:Peptidase family M50